MKRLCMGLLVVFLLFGLGTAVSSADPSDPVPVASDPVESRTGTVTLITGDQVELSGSGTPPRITPAAGRASMPFRVTVDMGHVRAVPGDAAALIAAGRLDARLFDVTTLLQLGYDDTRRKDLPLIVQYHAAAPSPTTAGEAVVRRLSSVDGAAISVPKRNARTWWDTTTRSERGTVSLDAAFTKIWLNGRRRLTLDHSAPQIGAPVAWQAGLTGRQVRVAVIDSGIDVGHPDLAGKVDASANFTGEPAGDRIGHGTHVASIVAGSGTGSGGRYRGIAPDARLLDVKVCDQDGFCAEDAILAGMEWAAATQHASVANVSLGGYDTPDVDPLEQAVNTLSAQYGTLFVIAAGNAGPGEGTVGSPGSADAALTVGAVDRQDVLAEFSSRGPRTGDGALKPDLTAPGVNIVAARAAGTELGEVVDQQYVKLSGTSMATPHVAGAAAILFQQHPDWNHEQVKAALMASAKTIDGVSVLDQGAGRVDIAKAITQSVTAGPASLSFGIARWPHEDDPLLSKTVTYRNTGSVDVSVDLTLQVTGRDTTPAPASLFAVNPSRIVVAAGGTAQVTVTADTRSVQVPVGRYNGRLVAAAAGTVVTTPLGVEKESEHYDVQITHIGRDGAAPGSYVTFLDQIGGDCAADVFCGGLAFGSAAMTTLRLPAGRYTLAEFSTTAGRDDMNLLMQPVLDLATNVSVTVDARRAKPVEMAAPRKSARLMQRDLTIARDVHRPGQVLFYTASGDHSVPLYTADLGGPPAGKDDMVSFVQGRFAEPGPTDDYTDSPYEYELADVTFGHLFTGLRLRPEQEDFATVHAQYAAVTNQPRDVKTQHSAQPTTGRPELVIFFPSLNGNRLMAKAPFHRTEYYLANGLRWTSNMVQGSRETGALDFLLYETGWHVYQPGRTYQQPRWSQGVFGPNFRQPQDYPIGPTDEGVVIRQGDRFTAALNMFVDSEPGHHSIPKSMPGQAQLYRNGQLIKESPSLTTISADLPPGVATYRLEATVTPPVTQISTNIKSIWTFRSGHVGGTQAVALPLLGVRYSPELDERNHARPGQHYLPVEISRQPGAGSAIVAQLTVDVSYDDGKTWHAAPLTPDGACWTATVNNPAGGTVSLRTRAKDTDGNQLEQTTIRAYLVNS